MSATERITSPRRILLVIVLLGLALRLAAGALLPDPARFFADASLFRLTGQHFWSTGSLGSPLYMPLYPMLAGLTGPGWGQVLVDIALSTALIWLIHALTLALFGDRPAALLAALGVAVYPPFVFFSVVGLTETLFMTLFAAALVCWYRGAFATAAVFTVLSILTRPAVDLLAPLLVLYFALVIFRMPLARALKQLAVYGVIYCVLMAPWWLHNYRDYGAFVRLDLAGGENFYSGNNPMNKTGGSLWLIDFDTKEFDGIKDPIARDSALYKAGINFIRQDPAASFYRAWLKFLRFWRLWPHYEAYAKPLYIGIYLVTYVPIFVLTLAYLVLWGIRDFFRVAPLLAFAGYLTLVNVVFAASIRYRMPIEPFMIALAATAFVRLMRRWPATAALLASPSPERQELRVEGA